MGLVQKSFSDIITFSRSSNATRVGPTGLVEYAPHNLLVRSQEFDNASWSKGGATVTANAIAAPDGTVTADKMIETATTAVHGIYQAATVVANIPHTVSVYAKAGERSWLVINPYTTGSSYVYFDLTNGAVGTIGSGITASIQSVGNGWYRCIATRTPTTTYFEPNIQVTTANGTPSYAGDGTSGVYIWGAQLAVGPYALDYTPTTTAAVYGPRFDYDPVTLAARGLLVEEQRTNLVTYSEQFDNAAWSKITLGGSVSVTANAGSSPDGTVNADLITINRSNASTQYSVVVQATSLPSSTNYIGSIYLKAATSADVGKQVSLWQYDGTNVVNSVLVTLTDTWQRYTTLATSSLPSGGGREVISVGYITTASGGGTQTGSVSFLAWGAQAEAGSFATSYIPTLASTVTRSADVASVNTLSPWYNQTEGTLFVEFVWNYANAAAAYDGVIKVSDGTSNNRYGFFVSPLSAGMGATMTTGGVNQVNIDPFGGSASIVSVTTKAALAYKVNDVAAGRNGTTVVQDTSATIPTVSEFKLGSYDSDAKSVYFRRIAYYPRRLTNAEIQALTS